MDNQKDFLSDAPQHFKNEELQEQVELILKIDMANLDGEALRQTDIFFKVQELYRKQSRFLRWLMSAHADVKLYRQQYYLGQLPDAVYQKEKLRVRPLKTEISMYMAADKIMQEMNEYMKDAEDGVSFLEDTMKHVRDRGFNIKTAVEWRQFMMGA